MRSLTCLIPLCLAGAALARPEITPQGFSGSENRINFDSFIGGIGITFGEVINTQFAPIGVVFDNPDFQNRANAWPSGQHAGHTLPNTMFVDQGGSVTPGVRPLELTFSTPVNRVGMYLCGSQDTIYTLRVFNASGIIAETLTRPGITTPVGTNIFLGIERPELITRVQVSAFRPQPGIGPANFFVDDVRFEQWPPTCYPNCDASTSSPILNANDFLCFLSAFAENQPYANCDGTTSPPAHNVNDFICFLTAFATGCS